MRYRYEIYTTISVLTLHMKSSKKDRHKTVNFTTVCVSLQKKGIRHRCDVIFSIISSKKDSTYGCRRWSSVLCLCSRCSEMSSSKSFNIKANDVQITSEAWVFLKKVTPARNEGRCEIKVRALWDVSHALQSHWCNCFCRVHQKRVTEEFSSKMRSFQIVLKKMEVLNFVVFLPYLDWVQSKRRNFSFCLRFECAALLLFCCRYNPPDLDKVKVKHEGEQLQRLTKLYFSTRFTVL